jgi:hypothetical protein
MSAIADSWVNSADELRFLLEYGIKGQVGDVPGTRFTGIGLRER